jgi:hypothetical protein
MSSHIFCLQKTRIRATYSKASKATGLKHSIPLSRDPGIRFAAALKDRHPNLAIIRQQQTNRHSF